MCRSIRRLREPGGGPRADDAEIAAAARQFVRKVSGFREPSARHREAFERAVADIARASTRLLDEIVEGRAG
ncbi:MAG: hypothetical protein KatS3mg013_0869 [Actinomycetota bacterium]|jgi:hypothetical protein|nr:MAG: hypothetical protein KatS3mg013_0869 [Actinomycetota bacterium]